MPERKSSVVLSKVIKIIAGALDLNAEEIAPQDSIEKLHIDSLGLIDIIMDIEAEFDIIIDNNTPISTVADLVACVNAELS